MARDVAFEIGRSPAGPRLAPEPVTVPGRRPLSPYLVWMIAALLGASAGAVAGARLTDHRPGGHTVRVTSYEPAGPDLAPFSR